MPIKFLCPKCKHKLKAANAEAGQHCKCTRCGEMLTIPVPVARRAPAWQSPLYLGIGAAVAVLILVGVIILIVLQNQPDVITQSLNDLNGGTHDARVQALQNLVQATPNDDQRKAVTDALEPLLLNGDVRGDLNPDVVLHAYLLWASKDNVPTLIQIVDNPVLPAWNSAKTGQVMLALGKLQDPRATAILAKQLPDPTLHDQAVSALKSMGPSARNAVLEFYFDGDPATRQRAGDLLAGWNTAPDQIAVVALDRLSSNTPDVRFTAASWCADNAPSNENQKTKGAVLLIKMLDDLSPKVNNVALRALKLWATKDSLPALTNFAVRQLKAAPSPDAAANTTLLIDLLAQYPDPAAAQAIAPQLQNPAQRNQASQALLKLGPVAGDAVLPFLNDPDAATHKEARHLAPLLKVPDERLLVQTLADVAASKKSISRTALQHLAKLRLDPTRRTAVAQALNAPLLDPDRGIFEGALDAVLVWGTKDNTATLLKIFNGIPGAGASNAMDLAKVSAALIGIGPSVEDAVIPVLMSPDPLRHAEACHILAEIGTAKSLTPLHDAGVFYAPGEPLFYNQTLAAMQKISARK